MELSSALRKKLLAFQKNEINEYAIYTNLAKMMKRDGNREILKKIAAEEFEHYEFFRKFTGQEVKPNRFTVGWYTFLAKIFGLHFSVRLMEKVEISAQKLYKELQSLDPNIRNIIEQESGHEEQMLSLLEEGRLAYSGAIVLGLNDALVELTGALAGLTLALSSTRLIAIVGLITGIAASLSMAASEYLSAKEDGHRNPLKASLATGCAYLMAVILLILPYFFFSKPLISLSITVAIAITIIFLFTFYISVSKNLSFKRRFLEMAAISLSVAAVNFGIGLLIKKYLPY